MGCPVPCRVLGGIPGFRPPDTSSPPPPQLSPQMSPDIVKYPPDVLANLKSELMSLVRGPLAHLFFLFKIFIY